MPIPKRESSAAFPFRTGSWVLALAGLNCLAARQTRPQLIQFHSRAPSLLNPHSLLPLAATEHIMCENQTKLARDPTLPHPESQSDP